MDRIKYAVLKGGQCIASQSFTAISATPSAHVFNIVVPSLESVTSREVLWTCSLTLRIERSTYTGNNGVAYAGSGVCPTTAGKGGFQPICAVNYGVTDSLAPFPLHRMVNTMTTTINNNSVSMNVQDALPALLRMCGPEELAEHDASRPRAWAI